MRRLTLEQFIEKSKAVHGDMYTYTTYVKNSVKVAISCPAHGVFMQRPADHMNGDGCPNCKFDRLAALKRGTLSSFIERANAVHDSAYDYNESVYVNAITKLTVNCRQHGPFLVTPDKHLGGIGCVKCSNGISRGERKIQQWLDTNGITYEREKRFPGLCGSTPNSRLRFDFFLPDYDVLIEFDGEHHFTPVRTKGRLSAEQAVIKHLRTVENDSKKTAYAQQHGYQLLRIRYIQDIHILLSDILKCHQLIT